MIVNNSAKTTAANPFDGSASKPAPANATTGKTFEEQLSSLLAESLQKMGVAPGQVNITIQDGAPQGVNKAAARQILVSYTPTATTPVSAEKGPANPFSGTTGPIVDTPKPIVTEQPKISFETPWAPYSGPRDSRDGSVAGGGKVSASGAPMIELNAEAARNQYNYAGPAARNPYFTSPSNPLRDGYVQGFNNWFQGNEVLGGAAPVPMNKLMSATEEGANEALRLVQQFNPDAKIVNSRWGSEGGPYSASKPTYEIELGSGRRLNAGLLLNSYYNGGRGVIADSDRSLSQGVLS